MPTANRFVCRFSRDIPRRNGASLPWWDMPLAGHAGDCDRVIRATTHGTVDGHCSCKEADMGRKSGGKKKC